MASGKIPIHPAFVGLLALVCLVGGAVLWLTQEHTQNLNLWAGGMMRGGLLLGAFWIAMPSKHRDAAWEGITPATLIGAGLALVAFVWRPKVMFPLLLVVAIVGWFLRPRGKRRPRNREGV